MTDLNASIWEKSRTRVRMYVDSRDDWNVLRNLKSLTEQAVRDYEHRAVLELVQNAHDAQPGGTTSGHILIRLDQDEGEHGVLYVANTGQQFTRRNFDAICDVADSDKSPDEGIGNKGIGFKSTLQLCHVPEVFSAQPGATGGSDFDGYCFRFADGQDFVELAGGDVSLAEDVRRDVLHLFLPVPIAGTPEEVRTLRQDGFVTVIRLPLKSDGALAEAQDQLRSIESGPPLLLFLRRIASLTIEERGEEGIISREHRRRAKDVSDTEGPMLFEVDLGADGSFLLAERVVDSAAFKASIDLSVESERISEGWRDWKGEARVGVAVALNAEVSQGRLYTFLPMGPNAVAPLAAHVNAPFFAKLARADLEESIPLNEFLLDEVADLCAETILLAAAGALESGVVVDLLCWTPPAQERLLAAFKNRDKDLASAAVVPQRWPRGTHGALDQVRAWEFDGFTVFTRDQLSKVAKAALVDDSIEGARLARLDRFATEVVDRSLSPAREERAMWAESLAAKAAGRTFRASWWQSFYDELEQVISDPTAMRGTRILIDDDLKLQRCGDPDSSKPAPAPFFSPRVDEAAGNDPDADLRIPATLKRRIFFVNQGLRWNIRDGQINSKRPGRRFLESGGLVNEYRATELFPVFARAMKNKPSDALARDTLRWVSRFVDKREEAPWKEIVEVGLRVPTRGGDWIPATRALFSRAWGGTEPDLLENLVERSQGVSADLAALSNRFILEPSAWPFTIGDEAAFADFLERIGVRRGLWPVQIPRSSIEADGRLFADLSVLSRVPMSEDGREQWRSSCENRAPAGLKPYTPYRTTGQQYRLPGQDDHANLSDAAKRDYAHLVVRGLQRWPDWTLHATFRRYNNHADSFTLPTPAYAFLELGSWTPMSRPGDRNAWYYVPPSDAWSYQDADAAAPNFAPFVPAPIRRASDSAQVHARLSRLGLNYWDDRGTAPARVRLFATLLSQDAVPDTAVASFKKGYEDAWADVAEHNLPDPLADHPDAQLIVTRRSRLRLVPLTAESEDPEPVYVQDNESPQVLRLLEQSGSALVRLRHADGARVVDLLAEHLRGRIRPTSTTRVSVSVDGEQLEPSDAGMPLVTEERLWLLDLIAALVELRSGQFLTPGPEAVRKAVSVAERIRVVTTHRLEALIDGMPVELHQAGGRVLALPDDTAPTIVVEATELDERILLQRLSPALSELIGYPGLGDTFRVTLSDLFGPGWDSGRSPTLRDLADVLGEPEERLREIRDDVREPAFEFGLVLIPVLASFDSQLAVNLRVSLETLTDTGAIAQWLDEHVSGLPIGAHDLIAACQSGDLNTARALLGISLRDLNAVIDSLGPPFERLQNPSGIKQEFDYFVMRHKTQVQDRLRSAFLPSFLQNKKLDEYVGCRELQGLDIDSVWPDEYFHLDDPVIATHIDEWLNGHGAQPLTSADASLAPLVEVRRTNRARVSDVVSRASVLIRAWEKKNGRPLSDGPGSPESVADKASAAGILDFELLTDVGIVSWLERDRAWPIGMPGTLDPEKIGVTLTEIEEAARAADDAARRRRDADRQIELDGKTVNAEEKNFPAILEAIRASLSESFLATPAKVSSLALQSAGTAKGRRRGGRGTTAARQPRLSPAQMDAVGLSGEVAAYGWLEANYDEFTDASWCSGYRNRIDGAGGDDSHGYDFEILTPRQRLMFEVKATTGAGFEFDLTDVEMRAARRVRRTEQYHILFVTHALTSEERAIYLLPNPLGQQGIGRYRTVGSGLRLKFEFDRPE